jgi:hypothetical protein
MPLRNDPRPVDGRARQRRSRTAPASEHRARSTINVLTHILISSYARRVSEPRCRMYHRCILYVASRYRRPRADQAHGHRPAVLHLASCVSLTDRHSHAIESPTPLILGGRGVGTKAEAGNDGLPENVQGLVSSAGSDITVWFERGKDETLPTRRTCDGLNSDYCTASIHDLHSILLRVVPCFYACTSNLPHMYTSPGSHLDRPTRSRSHRIHQLVTLVHLSHTSRIPRRPRHRQLELPISRPRRSTRPRHSSTLLPRHPSTRSTCSTCSRLSQAHTIRRGPTYTWSSCIMASWHHGLDGPVQLPASRSTLNAYPPRSSSRCTRLSMHASSAFRTLPSCHLMT